MSRRHHKHNLSTAGLLILPPSWLHVQLSPSWSEVKVAQSCPHGLYSPWNSPGQNTGVGSLSLLQGIFPTQGLNPGLCHCRWILYQLNHKGSLRILEWVAHPFSSGSSWPRNWTRVSCISGRFLPAEPQGKPKNTGVGSLSLLQGIFPIQELNQDLLHCRQILYQQEMHKIFFFDHSQ